ncbi:hypothetical protein [Desulfocurvus sp. DL9XJH121]
MPRRAAVILLALCLAAACAACSGTRTARKPVAGAPAVLAGDQGFKAFAGEYENTTLMVKHPPATLAVLPFGGDPTQWTLSQDSEDPRSMVRLATYNHIAALPFGDQELFETDARLAPLELDSYGAVSELLKTDPARLHSILGVDAVVIGEVTHYDRTFAGIVSQAAVGCRVRMLALPSGELLWRAVHVSRGFGGGVSITPVGLALSALSSLWNLRGEQLQRETDTLFREIASTIRVPDARSGSLAAPTIDLFMVEGADGVRREGEALIFRLAGSPGARASAHLSGRGFATDVVLRPAPQVERRALRGRLLAALDEHFRAFGTAPTPEELAAALRELDSLEIYQGAYYPESGAQARGVSVHGVLLGASGGRSVRAYPRTVSVDAAPPAAPEGLEAQAAHGRVRLTWDPVRDEDLAAYEVWTSPRGLTGFSLAARSESPEAVLDGLPDFAPLFVRVTALDAAGNRSGFSAGIKTTPLPEPGLEEAAATSPFLESAVDGVLYLPREFSPYLVRSTLTVPPGSALHAAPGVVLRFAQGAGLVVKGELALWGEAENPVRLVPETPASRPGSWAGLRLDGATRALVNHAHILGARVGLAVAHSAPRLHGAVIRASSQAGMSLESGAKPDADCCLIKGNGGMGGVVTQGFGLGLAMRHSTFDANAPFDVQNYSTSALDLRNNYWTSPHGPSVLGPSLLAPALDAPWAGCPAP